MTFTSGENVGPYRVIEQLGSGGMATVFKAYHASLDRYVAIKVLHPAFKADPQFFERFKREARIVANLEHPNIIPVYDFNEHNGEPYLVMRFVEGDTLKPQMKGQPMPAKDILQLMRPVCQALNYAHNQGVLHRDIKPSNIMVTSDGSIFITDFGLARMVQAGESTLSQDMMVGTPQYISPEQAQGMSELDGRTDIYSLGVVLFEMLTGRVPFHADTPFATVHDHIYTPLPLPSSINPDIDPAVERMLLKALSKEPEDRFATAADLLESLEGTLGAKIASAPTVVAAPDATVTPKRSGLPWWAWAAGAVLILCLVGAMVTGLLFVRSRRNRQLPNDQPVSGQVADSDRPVDGGQPPLSDNQRDQPPQDFDPDTPDNQLARELTEEAERAMQDEQFEEAIELFEEAIGANSHHLPAYFGLSEALRQVGEPEAGLGVLEEAIHNNPDNPLALMRLGEALLDERPEEALPLFEEASAIEPNAPVPYAGQALALLHLDEDEAAREAIDKALELDPGNPEARLADALYMAKQGNRREAIQELQYLVQDNKASFLVKQRARELLRELRN